MPKRTFLRWVAAAALLLSLQPAAPAAVRSDHDRMRFIAKGVDLTAAGNTVVVPAQARTWRTTRLDVQIKSSSGFVSVASASFGGNSAAFDNVMAIAVLGTASAVNAFVAQASLVVLDTAIDATTSGVRIKVTTGAVATALTADVIVEGYFTEP